MASDEELIAACAAGDRNAFDTLFERYRQPVWGYFRRRLTDSGRAEELTQDTFLAVLSGAKRYEGRSSFRTWLYGIAAHLLAAERRRPAEPVVESESTKSDADNVLWIRQVIARLDDIDREVILLREFEDLSYAEIATLLQVPVNTVRSRLARARIALRQALLADASSARWS